MEPITIAMAGFSALKAGLSAGKEIASMGKQIGSMFDAIDECKAEHNKKKGRQSMSANEEALDTFVNRKKAEDLERQLREVIVNSRGLSAWQELVKLRGQIRRERTEKKRRAALARQELVETIAMSVLGLVAFVAVFGGGIALILSYQGRL